MTKTDPLANSNLSMLPAIAVAVWMAVLVAAFLANRGADIGQLSTLVGRLADGALAGAGIIDSLSGIVIACLITAAWYGVGVAALRVINPSAAAGGLVDIVLRIAIGAAIYSLLWF